MKLNPQAEELNEKIRSANKNAFESLSKRGKGIYFPKAGILAQTAEAKDVKINATIGIAVYDDGTPMRLVSIADNISLPPKDVFNYAPSYGKPELRKIWKEMIYRKNSLLKGKNISLPVVTNALTHGLSIAGYLFVDEGDPIIVPDLYWENYSLIFENTYGARLDTFKLFSNGKFNITGFEEKLLQKGKKKIILLNFPNNPCGYTPTDKEVMEIIETIKKAAGSSNIVVLVDDAY